jgi:hypothetical protein
VRGHVADDQGTDDHADRDVDEEVPVPPGVLREHPAQQQSDRGAASSDHRPVAERAAALVIGEGHEHDRQRRRGHGPGGQTLQPAQDDQQGAGGVNADQEREQREGGHPAEQHVAASEQVRGAAPQQQETAEGQDVGGHDPLDAAVGEVQLVLDDRERDADDGCVQHDHELGDRDEREHRPPRGVSHQMGPPAPAFH